MTSKVPESQIEYYKKNPPKSLAEFVSQPTSIQDIEFDGHGFTGKYPDGLIENPNIIFWLSCNCGNKTFFIIAESKSEEIWFHKNLVIAERYYLKCTSCDTQHLFFDSWLHGYNPEVDRIEGWRNAENLDNKDSKNEGMGERINCKCSNCKNETFEIFARFEYPGDLFEDSTFAGREQEFFSWFTGVGKCSNCSSMSMPIDFECA
jgi:hypothetical protein